jgi:hypothetical protein
MKHPSIAIALLVTLAGCATTPNAPTARVMPAPGKPFEVFAKEQESCKSYASDETSGGTVANLKQFGTAAVSTALGGGLGAAIHGIRGAEIGGAAGSLTGGGLASRGSAADQRGLQSQYDLAYSQCMYAHGNQVAGTTPARGFGVAAATPAAPGFPPEPQPGPGILGLPVPR